MREEGEADRHSEGVQVDGSIFGTWNATWHMPIVTQAGPVRTGGISRAT